MSERIVGHKIPFLIIVYASFGGITFVFTAVAGIHRRTSGVPKKPTPKAAGATGSVVVVKDTSTFNLDWGSVTLKLDLAMGKSKTLSLAVSAIQNLKEIRGSTSRDIINYIIKAYQVDRRDAVRKQVGISLKRGVAYGILKRENGCYTLPIETRNAGEEIAAQEIGLIETCRRSNKRSAAAKGKRNVCKNRKCRRPDCRRGGKSCTCSESRKTKSFKRQAKLGKNTDSKSVKKLFGTEAFQGFK